MAKVGVHASQEEGALATARLSAQVHSGSGRACGLGFPLWPPFVPTDSLGLPPW